MHVAGCGTLRFNCKTQGQHPSSCMMLLGGLLESARKSYMVVSKAERLHTMSWWDESAVRSMNHWHTNCSSASADDLLAPHAQYGGEITALVRSKPLICSHVSVPCMLHVSYRTCAVPAQACSVTLGIFCDCSSDSWIQLKSVPV